MKWNDLNDIRHELNKVNELVADVHVLSKDSNLLSEKQKSFDYQLNKLSNDVTTLKSDNAFLKDQISRGAAPLSHKFGSGNDILTFRDFELMIVGIPFVRGEDLLHLLSLIAAHLNLKTNFNVSDIASCYRIKSRNESRPIIVRFCLTFVRDNWIIAMKALKRLFANLVSSDFPHVQVFIFERATRLERDIFNKAKSIASDNAFKYVWIKRGLTFMKKNDDSPVIRISSESDLHEFGSSLISPSIPTVNASSNVPQSQTE